MMQDSEVYFHAGCVGCTRQSTQESGIDYCFDCCYFEADWGKPNLYNNSPPPPEKSVITVIREAVKMRRKLKEEGGIEK